jgi:hypothetical protein
MVRHTPRLRRQAGRVAALFLTLSAAGCGMRSGDLKGHASDTWTRSYTLQDGGELQVVGGVGKISVQGGTGATIEVKAERRVSAATNEGAAAMVPRVRISEDVAPDKIVLRSEGLGGIIIGVEIEVDFDITVPASTRLRLHTAGGDISIANVSGIVVASSTNGAITAKSIGGGVDARSTNGNLTLDLASVGKDAVDIRATNGNISLTLPAAADANLEASCVNGTIDIADLPLELTGEQSRRRARGRLNGGGAPVEATTTNGDIRIRPRP